MLRRLQSGSEARKRARCAPRTAGWTIGPLAIAASLVAGSAHGEDPSLLRLEWNAPVGCPTREAVVGRIGERSAKQAGNAEVDARFAVTAEDAGGWSARVSVGREGLESTRILTAPSCAEVVDGVVVVIALVLGPTQEPPPSEPPPATPTAATAAPLPEARVAAPAAASSAGAPMPEVHRPSNAVESRSRPVLGLTAVALVEAGALPGLSYGVGALVSASTPHFRAEVGAEIFADRSIAVAAVPGAEVQFGFWSARGGACWLPFRLQWRPAWCAEFEWGQMSGRATGGGVSTLDAHKTWLAAATGPYLEWSPRAGLALLVRADAVLPLTPTTFGIDASGIDAIDVYRPGTVAARVLAGGELRF
jgi:hypothetical protein